MKFTYLPTAQAGLERFRHYYGHIFFGGMKHAREHYFRMKRILRASPQAGRPVGEKGNRIYAMPRTPFSVIYRIREDHIEVLCVRDRRADNAEGHVTQPTGQLSGNPPS